GGSVDCLISNCVINLAPDKSTVFREMYRVLKPGGRVAVSDIALKKALPPEIGQDLLAYIGCIAGALLMSDYERMLRESGFREVQIIDSRKDLNVYSQVAGQSGCCAPAMASDTGLPAAECCAPGDDGVHAGLADLARRYDFNEFAASVQVYALK